MGEQYRVRLAVRCGLAEGSPPGLIDLRWFVLRGTLANARTLSRLETAPAEAYLNLRLDSGSFVEECTKPVPARISGIFITKRMSCAR